MTFILLACLTSCFSCIVIYLFYRNYLYQTHWCPCESYPCRAVRPPVDRVHWQSDRPAPVRRRSCPTDRFPCHAARPWECYRRQFPLQEVRSGWVSERQTEPLKAIYDIKYRIYIAINCIFRVFRSNYKSFYGQPGQPSVCLGHHKVCAENAISSASKMEKHKL